MDHDWLSEGKIKKNTHVEHFRRRRRFIDVRGRSDMGSKRLIHGKNGFEDSLQNVVGVLFVAMKIRRRASA